MRTREVIAAAVAIGAAGDRPAHLFWLYAARGQRQRLSTSNHCAGGLPRGRQTCDCGCKQVGKAPGTRPSPVRDLMALAEHVAVKNRGLPTVSTNVD